MYQIGRPGLTPAQKQELWIRRSQGKSLCEIGRALGKYPASIFGVLRYHGGYPPQPRRRAPSTLSLEEREEISRGLASGDSLRAIAARLRRAPSTVSREVGRNGGRGRYRAAKADNQAWRRATRPKPCALARDARLRRVVAQKLALEWSPEQIAGWLKRTYPNEASMHVSHETIYKSLFVQSRGVLKKELLKHLRTKRSFRQAKTYTVRGQVRARIIDGVSISERPPEIEDRAVPGHWEGDLISGSGNTHVATLVERHSRFTVLVKVKGKDTVAVVGAISRQVRRLPRELRRSLTWDRGMEMAEHKSLTLATDLQIYFCDPRSPWQRGTNENTNKLLRQYLPRKTDLSVHSQAGLNRIAKRLNQRPRKTLNYLTPAQKLQKSVAMID